MIANNYEYACQDSHSNPASTDRDHQSANHPTTNGHNKIGKRFFGVFGNLNQTKISNLKDIHLNAYEGL